jgi:hypothetical protein
MLYPLSYEGLRGQPTRLRCPAVARVYQPLSGVPWRHTADCGAHRPVDDLGLARRVRLLRSVPVVVHPSLSATEPTTTPRHDPQTIDGPRYNLKTRRNDGPATLVMGAARTTTCAKLHAQQGRRIDVFIGRCPRFVSPRSGHSWWSDLAGREGLRQRFRAPVQTRCGDWRFGRATLISIIRRPHRGDDRLPG